jgi:hypothetical protein
MTALLDSGHVPQKNFPSNNFRELNRQYMLKHPAEEAIQMDAKPISTDKLACET